MENDAGLSHFERIMIDLVHIESCILALIKLVAPYEDETLKHSFKILLGIVTSIRSYLLKGKDDFILREIK